MRKPVVQDVALVVLAYLVGSIPMAYLVGKAVKGIDLRQYGSGNLGGANVWEHVGRLWVFPTGGFDYLVKGMGMVALARWGFDEGLLVRGLMGLAAMAGHNWSLYLRFTGGRGVAVGLGAISLLSWQQLAILATVGLGGRAVFRATGLAVFAGVLLLPVTSTLMYLLMDEPLGLLRGEPLGVVVFSWGFAALTLLKRALGNQGRPPLGMNWRQVLWHRLLFDRDVADREGWVRRGPPA